MGVGGRLRSTCALEGMFVLFPDRAGAGAGSGRLSLIICVDVLVGVCCWHVQ